MSNRIYLCSVKDEYIDYLREFDDVVRDNKDGRRKYVGIIFEIDDQNYYAPLASPKDKYFKINDKAPDIFKIKNARLGVINLNNMIPVPDSEIVRFNINTISDEKYKNLLRDQIRCISSNRKKIIDKAKLLYSIVNSGEHPKINKRCCNFKLLEIKCNEYIEKTKEVIYGIQNEVAATELETGN